MSAIIPDQDPQDASLPSNEGQESSPTEKAAVEAWLGKEGAYEVRFEQAKKR